MPVISTELQIGGLDEWLIVDELLRLRVWATDRSYDFPPTDGEWSIGAGDGCWLALQDSRVSRQHAKLAYDHASGRWIVTDLGSKNGVSRDGIRERSFALTPGVEIGLGGLVLIAESQRFLALRELLSRWLGWHADRRDAVDLALRAVRGAAAHREGLQLCGDGDLVSVAQLLHRHTLGDTRPFVVCGRRRGRVDPTARPALYFDKGMEAVSAAAGGTLCVWRDRPADFGEVIQARRELSSRVQLVVCTSEVHPSDLLIAAPIVVPPLAERAAELDRVIDAYAIDAGAVPGGTLTSADREWIRRFESATFGHIERATRRLVAIRRNDDSITHAAAQLGMSHSSLSEWIARRALNLGSSEDGDSGIE